MSKLGVPLFLLAAVSLALPALAPAGSVGRVAEVRLADDRGDYGPPNPFRHYPRGPGYVRMGWVYDTLVWKDERGQFVPALAASWYFDPERLSFTFRLDPRARWHDGLPVTAADVAFTIAYLREHPYPWVSLEAVGRVEVVDDHTITLGLASPYAPFLAEVAGVLPVLPHHVWEGVEDPAAFDRPGAFVGSGPYRFRDFDRTRGTYLYEAFDAYHGGRPRADRLVYLRSPNPLASLSAGQADAAAILPEMAEPLRRRGLTVIEDERGWVRKLMINHTHPPLDDRVFRQALALAIDREELVAKGQRGFGSPASPGLLSPDHPWFNPAVASYPHDPGRARRLIEGLGYRADEKGFFHKEGKPLKLGLLASSLTVAGGSGGDRDGEILKRQLEAAGISVDLVTLETTTADDRIRNWAFDLAVSGHGGIGGDPRMINEMVLTSYGAGSVNSARFDGSAPLSELLEAQVREMDEERRKALVHRIQEVLAEELPAIPLYYPASLTAFHPGKGIRWFYTPGGIGKGVPIAQNKLALLP